MFSVRRSIPPIISAIAFCVLATHLANVHAGSIAGWGRGAEGQLGHGMRELVRDPSTGIVISTRGNVPLSPNQPVLVDLPESVGISREDTAHFASLGIQRDDIKQLSAGKEHTLLLTASGKVYAWGNSTRKVGRGRLGDSTAPADRYYPTAIPSERFENRKIVQIAAGDFHSLAVDETGQVWGWGDNSSGQLGMDGIPAETTKRLWEAAPRVGPSLQKESVLVPTKLCVRHPVSNAVVPLKVPSGILRRAISDKFSSPSRPFVAAGEKHSLVIAEPNGLSSPWCLYAFGDNTDGQTTSSSGQPVPIIVDGAPVSPTWVIAGPRCSLAFEDASLTGDWTTNVGTRAIGWGDNTHRLFGSLQRLNSPTTIVPPPALTNGNKTIPVEEIYISYNHCLIRIRRQPFHSTVDEQIVVTGSETIEAAKPPSISSVIPDNDDLTSLLKQTVTAATGNGNFNAAAVSRVAVIETTFRSGRFIVSDSDRRKSGSIFIVPGTKVYGDGIQPDTVISGVEYEQLDSPAILPRVLSFSVSSPPVEDRLSSTLHLKASSAEGHSLIAQGVDEVHAVHAVIINGSIQTNSSILRVQPSALEHYGFAIDQAQSGTATASGTTDSVSRRIYSNSLTGNRSKVSPVHPGMKVYGAAIPPGTTVRQVLPNDGIVILSNPTSATLSPATSAFAFGTTANGVAPNRIKTLTSSRLWNFNAWYLTRSPSSDISSGTGNFTPPVFSFDSGPTSIDSQVNLTESGFLFVPAETVVLRSVECDVNSPYQIKAIPVDASATLQPGMQVASIPHPVSFIGDKNPLAGTIANQLDTNDVFSLEKLTNFDIGALPASAEDIPTGTRINPRIRLVSSTPSVSDGTTQLTLSHRISSSYPAPGYQNKGVLIAFKHTPVMVGDSLAGPGIPQGSTVKAASYIDDSGTNRGERTTVSQFYDHSDFAKTLTSGQNTIIHSVIKLNPPPAASPGVAKDSNNVVVTRSPPSQIVAWGDNSFGQLGDGGSAQGVAPAEAPTFVRNENALSGFDPVALVSGRNFIFAVSPDTNNDSYRGRWDVTNDKSFRNEQTSPTDATVPLRLLSRIDFSHQPNPVITDNGELMLSAEIKGRYSFESLYRYDVATDTYVQDVNQPFQYPPLPSPQGANSPMQSEPVTWIWYHQKNNRTTAIDLRVNNLNNQRGTQTISTTLTASITTVDLTNYSQPYFVGLNRSSNLISLSRDEIDTERNRPLTKLWSATPYQTNRDGGAQLPGESEITSSSRLSWKGPNTDLDVSGEYFAIAIVRDGSGNSFRIQSDKVAVTRPPVSPTTYNLTGIDGQTKRLSVETDASASGLTITNLKNSPKASFQWFTRDFDSNIDDFKPVRNGGTSDLPITFIPNLSAYYKCRITDSANVWESTPALVWSVPSPTKATLARQGTVDATPGTSVSFQSTVSHALPLSLKLRRANASTSSASIWRQSRTTSIPLESLLSDSPQNEPLGLYFRRGYVLEAAIPLRKASLDDNDAEFITSDARRVVRQIVVRKNQTTPNPPTYSVSFVKVGPGTLEDDPLQETEEPPTQETIFLKYRNPRVPSEMRSLPLEIGSSIDNLTASDLTTAQLQWSIEFPVQPTADYETSIASKFPVPAGFLSPDYQDYIVTVYSFDSKNGEDTLPLLRDMVPTAFPTDRHILQTQVLFSAEVPPFESPSYQTFFGDLVLDQKHINPSRLSTVAMTQSDSVFLGSSHGETPMIELLTSQTPVEGQPFTLRMTGAASAKTKFQWFKQSSPDAPPTAIPGANTPRLQIASLKSSDSALYYVGTLNPDEAEPTLSASFDLRVIPMSSFAGSYSDLLGHTETSPESDENLRAWLGRLSISLLPSGVFSGRSGYRGFSDSLTGSFVRSRETTVSVSNRRAARKYLIRLSLSSMSDQTPVPPTDINENVGLNLQRLSRVGGSELLSQYRLPGESVTLSSSGTTATPRWRLNGVEINPEGTHALLFKRGVLEFSSGRQHLIIKSMQKETSGYYQVYTAQEDVTVSPSVPILLTTPTLSVSVTEMEDTGTESQLSSGFASFRIPRSSDAFFPAVSESPKLATAILEGGSLTTGSNSRPVDGYLTMTTNSSTGISAFVGKLVSGETFSGTTQVSFISDDVPSLPIYSEFRSTSSQSMNWTAGYINLPSMIGPRSSSIVAPQIQTFYVRPRSNITGLVAVSNIIPLSARVSDAEVFPFLPPSLPSMPIFRTPEGSEDLAMYLWGLSKNSILVDSPSHLSAQPTVSGITVDPPNQQRMTLKINPLNGIVTGSGINPTAARRDASAILRFEGVVTSSGGDTTSAKSSAAGFFKYGSVSSPSIGRWEVNSEN